MRAKQSGWFGVAGSAGEGVGGGRRRDGHNDAAKTRASAVSQRQPVFFWFLDKAASSLAPAGASCELAAAVSRSALVDPLR